MTDRPVSTSLPMELRRKYGLVHVPRTEKCRQWLQSCRTLCDELPPEHAGLRAAREVFPYEAREVIDPESRRVLELLDMAD